MEQKLGWDSGKFGCKNNFKCFLRQKIGKGKQLAKMEGAKRGKQIFLYLTNAITFFNSTLLWSFWSLKNPHWVVIQAHISYWKDYTFFNIFTIFLFFFFVFFAIDILFLQHFLTNDKWVWITIWWGFFKDQKIS